MSKTATETAIEPMVPLVEESGFKKWLRFIDGNFEKPFLVFGMLAIILIISYQTFYRYVLTDLFEISGGAAWTEETARYIFIWISYLAVPVAIKQKNNIRVDLIYEKLSARWQAVSWIVVDLAFLTLTGVVTLMGIDHLSMMFKFPQTTPALQIPFFIPYLILPVGFGLMSLRIFQDLFGRIKTCGIRDSLLGVICYGVLCAPVFLDIELGALVWLFTYFIVLLMVGVPIAISLGLSALATIIGAGTLPFEYVAQISFTSIDNFPIMAIPFFIAAGVFMGAGGLSKRLLTLADELLGSLYGGMALATIATSMFFAAISGSGPATVAAIGSLTIPAMVERGYDKYFSAAVIACAGAIGVMIPPSNPFVVYGVSAQASIGKLFMGGIIPGVLTGLILMAVSYYHSRKMGWRGEARERNIGTILKAIWNAKWALMVPVIILGGIYGGIMTPTESAAVSALYGLIVGCFVYKEINLSNISTCIMEACSTSAIVIVLVAMATIFGNIMTIEQVPTIMAEFILGLTSSKILILLLINLFLLWVGTFMEALAAIVILTPILLPVVVKVGVDPIHFGVIMVVNLAIGFVTPPVGVNLFVASSVSQLRIEKIAKAAMPQLIAMLLVLMAVTFIPEISLWLPRFMK